MRRILLLVTDLKIGGTPAVVRELAARLHAPPAVHVEVACLGQNGPVADQIRRRGIDVTPFGADDVYDLPAVAGRLVSLVRERHIDTVFSFLVHANAVAAIAAQFCGEVRFIQSIQTTQPRPRWHWRVQRWVQHAADRVVVPSPSAARAAMEWSDVPREKVVVIPNAVDAAPRTTAIQTARGQANPALERTVRVGFVGRLDPIKRIPDLIDAIPSLPPNYRLDVWGNGPERTALQRQMRELGVDGRVRLHGPVPSADEVWPTLSVLVLPSEAEGFGLVLIEAMAAGVPVVATDVAGIRDVVRTGETGLLVPPRDPAALSAAIRSIAEDAALRERLTSRAAEDVRARFTWDAVLPRYRELLRLPPPSTPI